MTATDPRGDFNARFDEWFSPARTSVVLWLLLLLSFPGVILGDQTFVARDFGLFSYPVALYHRQCFWRGEFPLWNPWHDCGIPFLAQFNTLSLYPLSLVYLLLPLGWSLSFFSLLHVYIAGMGMYTLARRWTGCRFAAALAAVAFSFNGFSLNLLMWPSHIATYAWMPWVVWSAEQGWQKGGRKLALAALFGSLQMLSGGPETILLTWLVVAGVAVLDYSVRRGSPLPPTRRLAAMVLLISGLCAAQLLPFLNLVAHSQRDQGYTTADWSIPFMGWANFFVPLFGCFLTRKGIYFQDQQYWTSSYFVGIGIVALAFLALWRMRSRPVYFLALLALLGLWLAIGTKGFALHALKTVFPLLAVVAHPIKFVLLAVFALPLLAGFGVARLQQLPGERAGDGWRWLRIVGSVVAVVILLLVGFARWHPQDLEVWSVTLKNGLGRLGFLAATIAVCAWLPRAAHFRLRLGLGLALLVLLWGDVYLHVPSQNPTAHRTAFAPGLVRLSPQPVLGESRAFVSTQATKDLLTGTTGDVEKDFLLLRATLFLDSNLLDGIPTLVGFYSLYPRTDMVLQRLLAVPHGQEPPRLLDFLGVSQETSADSIFKFQSRTNFLPMITGGQRPVFLNETNTVTAIAGPDFQPLEVVYLPPEARGLIHVATNTQVRVLSQRVTAQMVELEVEARDESLMVAAQSWHPAWRARVGNTATPVFRANYGFQAWQVPAGRSRVTLEFHDTWFEAGSIVSITTLLICLLFYFREEGKPLP